VPKKKKRKRDKNQKTLIERIIIGVGQILCCCAPTWCAFLDNMVGAFLVYFLGMALASNTQAKLSRRLKVIPIIQMERVVSHAPHRRTNDNTF